MRRKISVIGVILIFICGGSVVIAQPAARKDFPAFVHNENSGYTFLVDGKPFIVLGAQLWNSSSWPYILDHTWPLLKEMHCNTLEAPVYWQVVEPEPGKYRFDEIDSLIVGARKQGLRLILLWFGTYKNGSSSYAPAWVLQHPEKFPRIKNAAGEQLQILSPLSPANLEADKSAFTSLMRHLRQTDSQEHTVIMMQVENEPGSLGTDRDYSDEATKAFNDNVPNTLVEKMGMKSGNWQEIFGLDGAEAFSAHTVARYINEIAAAGQKEFNLPMYTNAWLRENDFERPGEYPSGGATSNMIAIWKAVAPSLILLAPDIYQSNVNVFLDICKKYQRSDNPLFIPEMGKGIDFARYQFYALGNYHALGVATYGIDFYLTDPGDERSKVGLDKKFAAFADNYRLLSAALPELAALQSGGKLKAAGEEYGLHEQLLTMGGYDILFSFGLPLYKPNKSLTGRVLIGELGEDEFLIAGFDCKFQFRPTFGSGYHRAEYVVIEEGYYEGGKWVRRRIWNGDELYHSTLTPEGNLLKVRVQKIK